MDFQVLDEELHSPKSISDLSNQQLFEILNTEIKYPEQVFEKIRHEIQGRKLTKEGLFLEKTKPVILPSFATHLKIFIKNYPVNIFILIAIVLFANPKAIPIILYFIYYSWNRFS